jgi:hypothetical protein
MTEEHRRVRLELRAEFAPSSVLREREENWVLSLEELRETREFYEEEILELRDQGLIEMIEFDQIMIRWIDQQLLDGINSRHALQLIKKAPSDPVGVDHRVYTK